MCQNAKKILIFAGTIEGRTLATFLAKRGVTVKVCVTTTYGKQLFSKQDKMDIIANPLTKSEMENIMNEFSPQIVVDATHPYAQKGTENIKQATEQTGQKYLRLLRPTNSVQQFQNIEYVKDMAQAIEYLNKHDGIVFSTIGSNALAEFKALNNYQQRVVARILPVEASLKQAFLLELQGKNLIAMQGPFSYASNVEMFKQSGAKYLLTKDTGDVGGFIEKIEAAKTLGMKSIVIGRPTSETGLSFEECKQYLCETLNLPQDITIVGIGLGDENTLTIEGKAEIDSADVFIGAKRMVDSVNKMGKPCFYSYKPEEIAEFIQNHKGYHKVVVVQSGDVGFYSGTKKLIKHLPKQTKLIPGISSLTYFAAKLKQSWEDACLVSMHGQKANLISKIRENHKVFALLGDQKEVNSLAEQLIEYNMENVTLSVGENLSYENERIITGSPNDFLHIKLSKLSVIYIYNPTLRINTFEDHEFIRGKVPMTKHEIRVLTLNKLQLKPDSVVFDIGAGTGSVAIAMADQCKDGRVYAIEKNEKALVLIKQNKQKFAVDNLYIVYGEATDAIKALPTPTHAFIGGSGGNLETIIDILFGMNPEIKIVLNAVTLETIADLLSLSKQKKFSSFDVAQITVANAEPLGRYNLLRGQNPIFIISFQGRKQ